MENLNIEEFNPKVAELQTLAGKAQAVDITDLKAVKEVRLELKTARVEISKTGKDMRENATTFAKAVIAREKELIALIEPQELRLQEAETEEKLRLEREERKAILPARVARIVAIIGEGSHTGTNEEQILDMDGATFEGLINRLQAEKHDRDRAEIARQQAEIDARQAQQAKEQERLDWESKAQERADLARTQAEEAAEEAREIAEKRQKEADEKKAREKLLGRYHQLFALGLNQNEQGDAYVLDDFFVPMQEIKDIDDGIWALLVDKIKTKLQERATAKAEAESEAKRARATKYKEFRASHGYTDETHNDYYEKIEGEKGVDSKVILFKKVGEFDLSLID